MQRRIREWNDVDDDSTTGLGIKKNSLHLTRGFDADLVPARSARFSFNSSLILMFAEYVPRSCPVPVSLTPSSLHLDRRVYGAPAEVRTIKSQAANGEPIRSCDQNVSPRGRACRFRLPSQHRVRYETGIIKKKGLFDAKTFGPFDRSR